MLAGQKFGHLEVVHMVREQELKTIRIRTWLVRCTAPVLRRGKEQPCGRQEEMKTARLLVDKWECCSRCRTRQTRTRRGAA